MKQTVASVRGVSNGFKAPVVRRRAAILAKDTPISLVHKCRGRFATCANKHKEVTISLGNCSVYRGRRRILTRSACSSRTSLTGPANSIFYTRKTKFIMS